MIRPGQYPSVDDHECQVAEQQEAFERQRREAYEQILSMTPEAHLEAVAHEMSRPGGSPMVALVHAQLAVAKGGVQR